MRRLLMVWVLAAGSAWAAENAPVVAPSAMMRLFVQPVALRGTLGEATVQVHLRAKEDFAQGLEGDYFRYGRSQKILLAGEMDPDGMFIEESENGTDVSGQWEGKLDGDVIRGTWTSADGELTKPFVLTVLRVTEPIPKISPTTPNATKQ